MDEYIAFHTMRNSKYITKKVKNNDKYSASFTAAAILLIEHQNMEQIILAEDFEELIDVEVKNNEFLGIKTEAGRKRVTQEIRKRHANAPKDFWSTFFNLEEKEKRFFNTEYGFFISDQTNFSKIPGNPIAYWASENLFRIFNGKSLNTISEPRLGMATANNSQFLRYYWEISNSQVCFNASSREEALLSLKRWFPYAKGGDFRKWFGNQEYLVDWENDGKRIRSFVNDKGKVRSHNYNFDFIFKNGITWSALSAGKTSFRTLQNSLFDNAGSSLFINDKYYRNYIFGLVNSKVLTYIIPFINPTLNYQPGTIGKIPFIYCESDANDKVTICIELSKKDWNSHETSWGFEISPLFNEAIFLEKAYNTWIEEITHDFFQIHNNEERLNKIFIDIYGFQEELSSEVPLKEITILQEELNRKALESLEPSFRTLGATAIKLPIKRDIVMQQLISYAVGVMMGRYRLDVGGLHIAHPDSTSEDIQSYTYNGQQVEIDEDAIVPLMGAAGEFPDDAVHRFKQFLDIVWGADTRTENMNFLQECLDKDLEAYMVKSFWKDHCKRYKKKPIYWLFSSPKGAFQVLVYMHRMNAFTVEKIRANYLIPHLKNLRIKIDQMESNSSSLSSQEGKQLDKLWKDWRECESYELLIKDMADRQVVFDLDDGVTENYKLFDGVVAKIK